MAFPFLSLPAGKQNNIPSSHRTLTKSPELRNHIYIFAAPTENPIHISCATSPKRRQSLIAPPPKSPFGVLTRVNRQIRSEYHAIQRDHIRIIVDWDEMPQYIATFCRRDPAGELASPHNLTVYVKVTRLQSSFTPQTEWVMDVLPVLELQAASGLNCVQFRSTTITRSQCS